MFLLNLAKVRLTTFNWVCNLKLSERVPNFTHATCSKIALKI